MASVNVVGRAGLLVGCGGGAAGRVFGLVGRRGWRQAWLAAILICCCAATVRGAGEGRGELVLLGTNVVSFGTYPNSEDRTARVQIKNTGEGALRIVRVVTTCRCMRVDGFSRVLAPDEAGEVAVTIMKNEVAGAYTRVFYIECDDPENRTLRVKIEGYAKPLFAVTCDAKTFVGAVAVGQVWKGTYTVTATEAGLALGAPTVQNRGARCEFSVRTNEQELISYRVTQEVTFEGEGLLESALLFPILRADGQKSVPVRLLVEAVRRSPMRAVPDRLQIQAAGQPVRRRMLLSLDSETALEIEKFTGNAGVEGVEIHPTVAKSGKAFFLDVLFSAEAAAKAREDGGTSLVLRYGNGLCVDVPVYVSP